MPSVKVGDVQVNYEEFGEGRPMLVIHGAPSNGRMFAALYEPYLSERSGWRRLYPHLLDYGDGGIPASINSSDAVVDILVGFIEAVAPGERFVVLGGSWGALLARGLIHRCLDQLDGVHMLVPLIDWKTLTNSEQQLILHRDPEFEAALQPGEESLASAFAAQSMDTLTRFRAEVLANWKDVAQEGIAPLWNSEYAVNPDVLPHPCPAPALIVCGRQDIVVGYKEAWSIVENFPRGTYAVLDRASHWLLFDQRPVYLALIYEWLDRVEEYIAQNTQS